MPSVVLLNVVPAFGNLLASLMLISPVPAVLKLRATGKLGVQDRIMSIMLLGSVHFITMTIVALFSLTQQAAERMWGTNAIIILMVYYFIPLSSMYDIIRRKNAISIYPPLACGAIANGGLWTVYGFALKDVNLWLPNLFGAVIGVVQLVLRAVYGAAPDAAQSSMVAASGPSSVATSSSPKNPLKTPCSRGGGADGPPHAESPEQHPAAKHPAAKEPRRPSILALLHPYQYIAAQLGDVEKGGSASTASPASNSVTVVATATSTAIKSQLGAQL
ncbi:hypothetical protein VOLCADRAFT_88688 [Volvox carteri f. nagariensis]|uniref:Bidirectional sugar transporter SWEET n=1 Tax=Volvox carteri f. nagariensis TaxID=3068 RepID=D8TPP3_VOLCA|nr:uncharacterized protein VOLCADRAFT_88688 [Volvox carteri f. nagariensis]EFJ50800.1 hypothetical protein VOLCADRAFT_88688 [Volvox carteri f. nagariensis]|eukprot:XP_002948393.1 hypothetical protein VOLCADRAFT_88688 [Volvox carteri f. nagariensis]